MWKVRKIRSGTYRKKFQKTHVPTPSWEFAPISSSLGYCWQNTSTFSLILSSLFVTDRWFLLPWRTGGMWGNRLKGRGPKCGFALISHSTTVLLVQSDSLGGCWQVMIRVVSCRQSFVQTRHGSASASATLTATHHDCQVHSWYIKGNVRPDWIGLRVV